MRRPVDARRRARALAILLLVPALAVAGCGPSAEETFRKNDLRPLRTRMDQDKSMLAGILRTVRVGHKKDAQAVSKQIDVIAADVGRVAALKPPGSVTGQFRQFVVANNHLIAALRRFAAA